MVYIECARCGHYSDDGEIVERMVNGKKKVIHLCPSCWDIPEQEKTQLCEKNAERNFGIAESLKHSMTTE